MTAGPHKTSLRTVWYLSALLLAIFTYFYGLDSENIPKNSDEYPYAHITRLTADSGHLLPLQSEMNNMRNTKPPLLFWQGVLSTDWGKEWNLWNLRYPSVVYTLLTTGLVFLLARRVSGRGETGFIAALAFLGFISTYRYGRPFLTNPPEVFWLFLPFFCMLYCREKSFQSRLLFPLLAGGFIGMALLYKSFVLVAPVGAALAWWYLHYRRYRIGDFLKQDAWKVAMTCILALGVFGLWFVLDPDPQAIVKEFILGENVGKMSARERGYIANFLWGGSSVWSLLLDYLSNAGLLIFPLLATIYLAIRQRSQAGDEEKLLWIWVLTLFMVFSLPSQRSGRYLLSAMPAVAVLLSIYWERISRAAFVVTLVFCALIFGGAGYISFRLQQEIGSSALYPAWYWFLLTGAGALALTAIFAPRLTRPAVPVVVVLVWLAFAGFMRPFDAGLGNFSAEAIGYAVGKDVWVPCNFRAKDEGHRFLLPGAKVHGYDDVKGLEPVGMSSRFPLFALRLPLSDKPDCPDCRVIGRRLYIRGRHNGKELREMILEGKIFQHLFVREYLIAAPQKSGFVPPPDACR